MNCFEHVTTEWPELTGDYVKDLGEAMGVLKERAEDLQSLGYAMMTMLAAVTTMDHANRTCRPTQRSTR